MSEVKKTIVQAGDMLLCATSHPLIGFKIGSIAKVKERVVANGVRINKVNIHTGVVSDDSIFLDLESLSHHFKVLPREAAEEDVTQATQVLNAWMGVTVDIVCEGNIDYSVYDFLNGWNDIDPYAELKAAFADGKQIQVFAGKWSNVIADWTAPVDAYRIVDVYTELEDAIAEGKTLQYAETPTAEWHNCHTAIDFDYIRSDRCTSNLSYRIRPDYIDWELDRKVMVSMDGVKWTPAHFAGTNKHGAHLVYAQGKSMHTVVTTQKQTSQYNHVKDV